MLPVYFFTSTKLLADRFGGEGIEHTCSMFEAVQVNSGCADGAHQHNDDATETTKIVKPKHKSVQTWGNEQYTAGVNETQCEG